MPTEEAITIIKEFTKSPSRQKPISVEKIWKAFPIGSRGMIDCTVREVLRKEQFDNMTDWDIRCSSKQATFTRRTNKVITAINRAFTKVSKKGAKGLYHLDFGYYMKDQTLGAMAFAYANSLPEAEQIFETMYKPFCEERWWRHVSIDFLDFADQAEALAHLSKIDIHYNHQTAKFNDEIIKLQEAIEATQEKIKRVGQFRDATTQLLLMTVDD